METDILQQQLDEDQNRLDKALERKQASASKIGRMFHGLRAEYLGIIVEQDLEALEIEAYNRIPAPRLAE